MSEGVVRGTLVDVKYLGEGNGDLDTGVENLGVSALLDPMVDFDYVDGSYHASAQDWSLEGNAGDITHYRICPIS